MTTKEQIQAQLDAVRKELEENDSRGGWLFNEQERLEGQLLMLREQENPILVGQVYVSKEYPGSMAMVLDKQGNNIYILSARLWGNTPNKSMPTSFHLRSDCWHAASFRESFALGTPDAWHKLRAEISEHMAQIVTKAVYEGVER